MHEKERLAEGKVPGPCGHRLPWSAALPGADHLNYNLAIAAFLPADHVPLKQSQTSQSSQEALADAVYSKSCRPEPY